MDRHALRSGVLFLGILAFAFVGSLFLRDTVSLPKAASPHEKFQNTNWVVHDTARGTLSSGLHMEVTSSQIVFYEGSTHQAGTRSGNGLVRQRKLSSFPYTVFTVNTAQDSLVLHAMENGKERKVIVQGKGGMRVWSSVILSGDTSFLPATSWGLWSDAGEPEYAPDYRDW